MSKSNSQILNEPAINSHVQYSYSSKNRLNKEHTLHPHGLDVWQTDLIELNQLGSLTTEP